MRFLFQPVPRSILPFFFFLRIGFCIFVRRSKRKYTSEGIQPYGCASHTHTRNIITIVQLLIRNEVFLLRQNGRWLYSIATSHTDNIIHLLNNGRSCACSVCHFGYSHSLSQNNLQLWHCTHWTSGRTYLLYFIFCHFPTFWFVHYSLSMPGRCDFFTCVQLT